MFFALSKGILCAVALICICAVLVACSSNFMTTANYLINGNRNEIEYGELELGNDKLENNISPNTSTESSALNRETDESDRSDFPRHDHGLILLDITQQNLASAYRRYGISSIGIIVLESRFSSDIHFGDKIFSINGREVYSSDEFDSEIKDLEVGEFIEVGIIRDNRVINIKIKLEERISGSVSFD